MNISAGRGLTIVVVVTIALLSGGIWYMDQQNRSGHMGDSQAPQPPPPHGARELYTALEAEDVAEVKRLLGEYPDLLTFQFGEEGAALHVAARKNNVELIDLLLDQGADPGARGQWAGTALHWACWWGARAAAEELLGRGFGIEDKGDMFGSTPLLWACHGSTNQRQVQRDYVGTVKLLIEKGAAADTTNAEGMPATVVASEELRDLLKSHGATVPPNAPGPGGPGGPGRQASPPTTRPIGPMV
jgi:hypothetical protein